MGTVASIHVVGSGGGGAAVAAAVAGCFAELRELDDIFSTFRNESEISRIRAGELALECADTRVREVARACARAEKATRGRFSANWNGSFDPTGYVKGWAVDEVGAHHLDRLLQERGVDAVGINVGGDMRLRTSKDADWSWRVGIADPEDPTAVLAAVDVRNGAVATSGTAQRGAHIIDPRTGEPALGARSVTVLSDSLTDADLWATAAVVAGDDLSWISDAPQTRGLMVGSDGTVRRWIGGVEVTVRSVA